MEYRLKMKKILVMLMVMIMCATTILPSETTAAAATEGAVQKVTLKIGNKNVTKKTKSMYIGSTATLKVKVTPTAAKKKITYKSSRRSVAVVNSKGKITAKRAGTTKITVTVTGKDNVRKTTYVKIRVKKRPVSKITLNKTSLSLYTGSSYTLKATVYPKKATNKKVSWISSNKNVAVVSSTGKVTAKNPGTAVITVKAKDGSKKQRTCKVTVRKKPVDITGLEILDKYRYRITFSEPVELTKDNFTVKKKKTKNGAYYHECSVTKIISADNKTYIIYLDSFLGDYVEAGNYAGIFVTGLTGKSMIVKQIFYAPESEEIEIKGEVGSYISNKYLASYSTVGYCKYELIKGSLVKGIKLDDSSSGDRYIYGAPKEAANNQIAVFRETDEMGNQREITIVQNFYDAENIVCKNKTVVQYIGEDDKSDNIYPVGGSGSYIFSLEETDADFIREMDNSGTYCYIYSDKDKRKKTKPGTYTARIKVTDAANPEIYTYVTYTWIFKEHPKSLIPITVTFNNITWHDYVGRFELNLLNYNTGLRLGTTYREYIDGELTGTAVYKGWIEPGIYDISTFNDEDDTKIYLGRNLKITSEVNMTFDWPTISGQSAE